MQFYYSLILLHENTSILFSFSHKGSMDFYLLQQQYQIKAQINEGYAKVNTLQNQTQYAGYFNIKYKKSDNMNINIPINNTIYTFQLSWNND